MPNSPTIIRHHGRPVEALLPNGQRVYRKEELFVRTHMQMYKTQDYDNHFIFLDPTNLGSTLLCTCGSAAVVAGPEGYKQFETPHGEVLMCLFYLQQRHHADGSH